MTKRKCCERVAKKNMQILLSLTSILGGKPASATSHESVVRLDYQARRAHIFVLKAKVT